MPAMVQWSVFTLHWPVSQSSGLTSWRNSKGNFMETSYWMRHHCKLPWLDDLEIIFNFPIKEKEVKTQRIQSKRGALQRKTSVSVATMMMMLPAQQGVRDLGIPPPSISTGDSDGGGGDIKENLNTSGTTEQCRDCSSDSNNKSSNHSSLLCFAVSSWL